MITLNNTAYFLKSCKQSEYLITEQKLIDLTKYALPIKSKTLSTNFIKKIFSTNDDLQFIIICHLYFERYINQILYIELKNSEVKTIKDLNDSFYKKVMLLNSQNIIEDKFKKDLLFINYIRNKFAHKLNFKLIEVDIWELTQLNSFKNYFSVANKKHKSTLYRILLKLYFFELMIELNRTFEYLNLLDES
jgi:hypothetical protein